MSHHRRHPENVRRVNAEIVDDNPNANGPSPSGLGNTLAQQGVVPELRARLHGQLKAYVARMETAIEELNEIQIQEAVLVETMVDEAKARYAETASLFRKNGS